jgi:hypothetical protein
MSPGVRKLVLTAHIGTSVGWLGALAVFLAHAVAGLGTEDLRILRATAFAMGLTAWFVILPLSLASLITGIVQAIGSTWGLVRHYWVVFKLLLTVVATAVLLLKLGPISQLAVAARDSALTSTDLSGLRTSLLVHAVAGMLVLLVVLTLAVFKPAGLTRYGRRANGAQLDAARPRWVKVFGVALIVLTLVLVAMMLGGNHGPSAHLPLGR